MLLKNQSAKLILCANHQQLLAGYWLGHMLQSSWIFKDDAAGHLACAALLEKYRHCPLYMIADGQDEDYRLENLPHTSGKTKRELIQRKLNQFFRGLDFRMAEFLDRQKDQRQDDRYLFFAINNAQFMQNWLALIQTANSLLVGIYPIASLSALLYKEIHSLPFEAHCLFSEALSSGLRQTYLHQGQLNFSRFVAYDSHPPSPQFYQDEAEKIRRYLLSQHVIETDASLHFILAMATENPVNPLALKAEPASNFSHINYLSHAKSKKLAAPAILETPEFLHMQLIADGHQPSNLAKDSLVQAHQLQTLKQRLNKISAAIATLGLILAGLLFYLGAQDQADLQKTTDQITAVQAQYQTYAKKWPVSLPDPGQLKAAVSLDLALAKASKSPRRVMQILSAALDKSPAIALNQLTWQATQEAAIDAQETALISAEIKDHGNTNHGTNLLLASFIRELKSNPMVANVILLSPPIEASVMAGNTVDEKLVTSSQTVNLKIELKHADIDPVLEVK